MEEKQVRKKIIAGIKRRNVSHFIFNSRFKTHLNHFRDQQVFENKIANLKIIQSPILKT